ncbi:acyl carrier protein, partial [Streptomyces sp. NPDC019937]|uniref:acyl carrier protein n=1 Tax=Streptomyces sp. NPDC019937 TaxID=3154787 RepID=UPI0033EEB979
ELVRAQAAAVLGHGSAQDVPAERAFKELGFDSLTAVELRNGLAAATGVRLPATMAFDHPNATAIARFLQSQLLPDAEIESAVPSSLEDEVRQALVSLSLDQLKGAGLLDPLLALTRLREINSTVQNPEPTTESIDAMDGESLLRLALGKIDG